MKQAVELTRVSYRFARGDGLQGLSLLVLDGDSLDLLLDIGVDSLLDLLLELLDLYGKKICR